MHLFSFQNTNQINEGRWRYIFEQDLGKILIWQKLSSTWKSNFKALVYWGKYVMRLSIEMNLKN